MSINKDRRFGREGWLNKLNMYMSISWFDRAGPCEFPTLPNHVSTKTKIQYGSLHTLNDAKPPYNFSTQLMPRLQLRCALTNSRNTLIYEVFLWNVRELKNYISPQPCSPRVYDSHWNQQRALYKYNKRLFRLYHSLKYTKSCFTNAPRCSQIISRHGICMHKFSRIVSWHPVCTSNCE